MSGKPFDTSELRRTLELLVGQSCVLKCDLPNDAVLALSDGGSGIGYSQLNELLLLLGFDRITRSFFQFLVDGKIEYVTGASIQSLDQFMSGVDRFRALALLMFGNIKYGFKALSTSDNLLEEKLDQKKAIDPDWFHARHDPIRPIKPISPDETYYLGYIVERELKAKLDVNPFDATATAEEEKRKRIVAIGKANHESYLASDHLDVYVATSMRQRHEFLAVNKLTQQIFSQKNLNSLKLRWFDPTQAYCSDRIDKGLSEGLMLRRASCTIYLAQELDTLGKDSELASTLAQGKPVIAYVPEVGADFVDKLLEDLRKARTGRSDVELLLEQLQVFEPGSAWADASVRGWIDRPESAILSDLRKRLQSSITKHYDSRAKTLRETHPLGVQVNLATGVANGVLVIRTIQHCAQLVEKILTRTLDFDVEDTDTAIVLKEKISGCVFRIATADMMLTNAFWNFYLEPSE